MSARDAYFSFFMFTVDLRPDDPSDREVVIRHPRTPDAYTIAREALAAPRRELGALECPRGAERSPSPA